jgi:hypothetical protein
MSIKMQRFLLVNIENKKAMIQAAKKEGGSIKYWSRLRCFADQICMVIQQML